MIAIKPKPVENQYTRIPDHLLTAEDRVKRSIIDSLSSNGLNQISIGRAFTHLINRGKATPEQAFRLLQIRILRYSETPDRDIELIAALRDLSRGQQ